MYEHGTDLVIPSENWKGVESATVELCRRRPSGLTGDETNNKSLDMVLQSNELSKWAMITGYGNYSTQKLENHASLPRGMPDRKASPR